MIVKIKQEGKYFKQKGEVMQVHSADRVIVKITSSSEIKEFKESELSKVVPSEGYVWIISKN
jgi:hypothetical protein